MKLAYRILLPISVALSILLAGWSVLFYVTVVDEIDDETDDALEFRAESIILRILRGEGEEIPRQMAGDNSSYYLLEIPADEAASLPREVYTDENVYIPELDEEEPARVLRRLFRSADGRCFLLTVMIPTIEKVELREAILWGMVALYLVALLTILAVNFCVLHRMLRPLRELLRWLDSYTVGVAGEALRDTSDIPEYRQLYAATRGFTTRAEEHFERQKHFIGNAAHEMQTPLAVCRNRLEMLVDEATTLTDAQLDDIAKVQRTLDHMVHLNRSLLLLSKIDNGQFPESRRVDMTPLTLHAVEEMEEIYASRNIRAEVMQQAPLEVEMNPSLAMSLVHNLLANAFVHGDAPGSILVRLSADRLEIENDGAAGALDAERLFDRFYQGSTRGGSAGLGLAIVKAICRQYRFEVSYRYRASRHLFRVKFR